VNSLASLAFVVCVKEKAFIQVLGLLEKESLLCPFMNRRICYTHPVYRDMSLMKESSR